MKKNTIIIAVIILIIGLGIGFGIGNSNENNTENELTKGMSAGMHQMPDGTMMSNDMPMDMMGGMDHSAMMVSSEREFVSGMIPHHQEAIDTANEVLARGGSTESIRTLATEIIAAQEAEIAMLKEWHLDWYKEIYVADGLYQPMMRDLSGLSGVALDQRFLEDMIPHHMGAIMMAQSVRPYITNPEITSMADAIMTTQTAEIELMQDLLRDLSA